MIVFVVILRHAYNKNNHLGEENLNHVMDGWMRGGNQILYVIDIYICPRDVIRNFQSVVYNVIITPRGYNILV